MATALRTREFEHDGPPPLGRIHFFSLAASAGNVLFLGAIVHFWGHGVSWLDLGLMVFFYVITGLGITVGYHRMLTHRAFQTSKPVEYAFAVLGSMALLKST